MANKPIKVAKTVTPEQIREEKQQQALQFLASKKEQYFQIILSAVIRSGRNTNLKECIDASYEAADYTLEKLYTVKKEESNDTH